MTPEYRYQCETRSPVAGSINSWPVSTASISQRPMYGMSSQYEWSKQLIRVYPFVMREQLKRGADVSAG